MGSHIGQLATGDSADYLQLLCQLDQESHWLLLEPDERFTDITRQAELIQQTITNGGVILGAFVDETLVGYLDAVRGDFQRIRHTVYISMGVLQAFAGQGIGTQLLSTLTNWAQQNHIHRIELTVQSHNLNAISLYLKQGFVVEGTKRHSMLIQDKYVGQRPPAEAGGLRETVSPG